MWHNHDISPYSFIKWFKKQGCAYLCSCVQLFVAPWTVACWAPLSMRILQVRILEWVAMPSFRGSFQRRDRTQVSHLTGGFFIIWATREAKLKEKPKLRNVIPLPWLPEKDIPYTLLLLLTSRMKKTTTMNLYERSLFELHAERKNISSPKTVLKK